MPRVEPPRRVTRAQKQQEPAVRYPTNKVRAKAAADAEIVPAYAAALASSGGQRPKTKPPTSAPPAAKAPKPNRSTAASTKLTNTARSAVCAGKSSKQALTPPSSVPSPPPTPPQSGGCPPPKRGKPEGDKGGGGISSVGTAPEPATAPPAKKKRGRPMKANPEASAAAATTSSTASEVQQQQQQQGTVAEPPLQPAVSEKPEQPPQEPPTVNDPAQVLGCSAPPTQPAAPAAGGGNTETQETQAMDEQLPAPAPAAPQSPPPAVPHLTTTSPQPSQLSSPNLLAAAPSVSVLPATPPPLPQPLPAANEVETQVGVNEGPLPPTVPPSVAAAAAAAATACPPNLQLTKLLHPTVLPAPKPLAATVAPAPATLPASHAVVSTPNATTARAPAPPPPPTLTAPTPPEPRVRFAKPPHQPLASSIATPLSNLGRCLGLDSAALADACFQDIRGGAPGVRAQSIDSLTVGIVILQLARSSKTSPSAFALTLKAEWQKASDQARRKHIATAFDAAQLPAEVLSAPVKVHTTTPTTASRSALAQAIATFFNAMGTANASGNNSETLLAAANTFRTICEQDMSELSVLVADRVAALCCNLAARARRDETVVQHLQATVDDMFSQLLLLQTAYSSRHAAMLATLAAEPVLAATIIPRAATFLEAHTSILVQPSRDANALAEFPLQQHNAALAVIEVLQNAVAAGTTSSLLPDTATRTAVQNNLEKAVLRSTTGFPLLSRLIFDVLTQLA